MNAGQMTIDDAHWLTVERMQHAYTVEGEIRVLTWEKFWCCCGDRTCVRAVNAR
jgi:hypothetical protein